MRLLLLIGAAASAAENLPIVPFQARGTRPGYSLVKPTQYVEKTVDVFLDVFCEDSKATWPTLRALAAARPDVDVRVNLFPLPYNLGSWLPTQGCTAAALLTNASRTLVDCLDLIYAGDTQKTIKTLAMVNGTTADVVAAVVAAIARPLGVDGPTLTAHLQQGLEGGSPSYSVAKRSLKFGQSHGVFATPSILLNGVQIYGFDSAGYGQHAEASWTTFTVADWDAMLDL